VDGTYLEMSLSAVVPDLSTFILFFMTELLHAKLLEKLVVVLFSSLTSVCLLNKEVLKLWPQVPWQDFFMSEILECGNGFWTVILVENSGRSHFG
jgi:hypothetical protein